MLFTASKYPKRNLDCSLTLQNSSQKKRLGFESDVYHFDTCPRLLGLKDLTFDNFGLKFQGKWVGISKKWGGQPPPLPSPF